MNNSVTINVLQKKTNSIDLIIPRFDYQNALQSSALFIKKLHDEWSLKSFGVSHTVHPDTKVVDSATPGKSRRLE
jgi:hypothetical protein